MELRWVPPSVPTVLRIPFVPIVLSTFFLLLIPKNNLYVRAVTETAKPLTKQEFVVGLIIPPKRYLLPSNNRRPWVTCLEKLLGALQAPLNGAMATEPIFVKVVSTVLARAWSRPIRVLNKARPKADALVRVITP